MGICVAYATNKGREFIEDQSEWPHSWEQDKLVYDVVGVCRTLSNKKVRKALNLAMTTWDIEIEVVFKPRWFYKYPRPAAHIVIDFHGEEDDYFLNRPSVLAYAYFPGQIGFSGRVVFNDAYIWTLNGDSISGKEAKKNGWVDPGTRDDLYLRTYSIINVLIHELGHSLGLKHDVTGNNDGADVMDAFYGVDRKDLSQRDIDRVLLKYPKRVYHRFNGYNRLKRWLKRKKRSF